jgi:preprotein translocase subunit SecG
MHLDLRPFLVLWAIVILALVVAAFWRRSVAVQEDPALHLGAAHAGTAAEQIALAKKLEHIDKWMKILTVAVIVFGLLLGAAALYKGWVLGPSGL